MVSRLYRAVFAIYAQAGGQHIGRNILRALADKPLKPYPFAGLGEACSLGHRCALAHLKGVPAYGWSAWICWRFIVLTMLMPSRERRIRLALDWLLTPFGAQHREPEEE